MLHRVITRALVLSGLVLVGLTAYAYFAAPAGPALVAPETDVQVADSAAGQQTEFTIRLRNDSGRSVHVLGLAPC
jgi:hypothetical protein